MDLRLILIVSIVVASLMYLAVLHMGGGLKMDPFEDLGKTAKFTLYYMNGCPHCEVIKPEFKEFVAAGQFMSNGKPVTIRMLEQSEAGSEIDAKGIQGFPSFWLTTADGKDIEYRGDRSVPQYKSFITANIK
jgi:hypothetical protein